ncbi:hypothetical protein ACHAXN_009512 [Cyclotella atomus]
MINANSFMLLCSLQFVVLPMVTSLLIPPSINN